MSYLLCSWQGSESSFHSRNLTVFQHGACIYCRNRCSLAYIYFIFLFVSVSHLSRTSFQRWCQRHRRTLSRHGQHFEAFARCSLIFRTLLSSFLHRSPYFLKENIQNIIVGLGSITFVCITRRHIWASTREGSFHACVLNAAFDRPQCTSPPCGHFLFPSSHHHTSLFSDWFSVRAILMHM